MSRAVLCVTYNLPPGPCAAGTPLTSALPRSPLTGPGKRVCVMSAASVDRPYFRLQAAGPGGGARPQRLSLPDLRGLVQAGQYHRPLAPRGKAPHLLPFPPHTHTFTRVTMATEPLPSAVILATGEQLPAGIRPGMRCGAAGTFKSCSCQSIISVTQM